VWLIIAEPWCGLYVKKQVDSDVTCRPGIVMDDTCTSETKIRLSWPPTVNSTLKNFEMTLQYEYIFSLNNQKRHIVLPHLHQVTLKKKKNHFFVDFIAFLSKMQHFQF